MAAAHRATASGDNGAGATSVILPAPAGLVEGDVLLMGVTVRGGSGATTSPNHAQYGLLNIGGNPFRMSISPDGTLLCATTNGTTVYILRTSDFGTDRTVTCTNNGAQGTCWLPDGSKIYRGTFSGSIVNWIKTSDWTDGDISGMYSVSSDLYPLLPSPDSQWVYQCSTATTLNVIRTSDDTNVADVTGLTGTIRSGAWTSDSAYCYLVGYVASGKVDKVRSSDHTLVNTISVGANPVALIILPDQSYAYVANFAGDTVSAIRLSDDTVQATIAVGDGPYSMVATADSAFVYVGHQNVAQVKKIRTSDRTVVATITMTNDTIRDMVITPDGKTIYMAAGGSTDAYILAIDTATDTEVLAQAISHYSSKFIMSPFGTQLFMTTFTNDVRGYTTDVWEALGSPVNSGTDLQQSLWHRVATDNEPSTYPVGFDASRLASGVILAASGADPGQPIAEQYEGQANASGTTVTAPAVGSWASMDGIDVGFFGSAYGTTFTPPTDYTEPTNGDVNSTGTTTATATEVAYRLLNDVTGVGSIAATAADAAVNIGHHVFLGEAPPAPVYGTPVHLIGSGL